MGLSTAPRRWPAAAACECLLDGRAAEASRSLAEHKQRLYLDVLDLQVAFCCQVAQVGEAYQLETLQPLCLQQERSEVRSAQPDYWVAL